MNTKSFFKLTLLSIASSAMADAQDLATDVKSIQAKPVPKVMRCVLNGQPRSLAIQLSDTLAVGYDTWHGGLFTIWKPASPDKPLNLNGAVFTGAHGPQPTTNGKVLFKDDSPAKATRYHFSDSSAKLHYLGHQVGKKGLVTLRYAFRDATSKPLVIIEDIAAAGKNNTLHRRLTVSGLAEGAHVKIDFPKSLTWKGITNHSITLTKNGSNTFATTLP